MQGVGTPKITRHLPDILSLEEIEENIKAGKSYVLRFRSDGQEDKRIFFDDIIRGKIEMPENDEDFVLLKYIIRPPTYHILNYLVLWGGLANKYILFLSSRNNWLLEYDRHLFRSN